MRKISLILLSIIAGVMPAFSQPAPTPTFALKIKNNGTVQGYVDTVNFTTNQTATVSGGTATVTASGGAGSITITSNTVLSATSETVFVDTTSGNITVTLPAASVSNNIIYDIKKKSSDSNTVTITAAGSDLIDGNASVVDYLQGQSYTIKGLAADGTWNIL